MNDTESRSTEINRKATNDEARFQFSIRQMFLLTTVCALAAGFAGSTGAATICRVVVACYLMSIAAYVVLRLPFICREIVKLQARRERIRLHRKELEAMIWERRQKIENVRISDEGNLPSNDPPRRRIQFTVRTFFAAAFLISLFTAAAKLPDIAARIAALLLLAGLTFVGLYRTFFPSEPPENRIFRWRIIPALLLFLFSVPLTAFAIVHLSVFVPLGLKHSLAHGYRGRPDSRRSIRRRHFRGNWFVSPAFGGSKFVEPKVVGVGCWSCLWASCCSIVHTCLAGWIRHSLSEGRGGRRNHALRKLRDVPPPLLANQSVGKVTINFARNHYLPADIPIPRFSWLGAFRRAWPGTPEGPRFDAARHRCGSGW